MPRADRRLSRRHPSNVYIAAGRRSREELLAAYPEAILVTELTGQGSTASTGDYSRGAAGSWCATRAGRTGREMTIASNLIEMFATLEPGSTSNSAAARCADLAGARDDGGGGLTLLLRFGALASGAQNTWL